MLSVGWCKCLSLPKTYVNRTEQNMCECRRFKENLDGRVCFPSKRFEKLHRWTKLVCCKFTFQWLNVGAVVTLGATLTHWKPKDSEHSFWCGKKMIHRWSQKVRREMFCRELKNINCTSGKRFLVEIAMKRTFSTVCWFGVIGLSGRFTAVLPSSPRVELWQQPIMTAHCAHGSLKTCFTHFPIQVV